MNRGLLANISWLGAGNALVKPLWFVFITFVCVRLLGIAEYGTMNAALALAGIVSSLVNMGIVEYSIREVARKRHEASRYFSNLFPFSIFMSIAGIGLVVLSGIGLGHQSGDLLAIAFAGCYVMMVRLAEYCRAYYRAFETMRYEAVSIVLEKILVIGIGTALLLAETNAASVMAGMSIGMFLALAGNVGWLTRRIAPFQPELFDRAFLGRSIRSALPLGLVGIFVMVYFRTDAIMLEAMKGDVATGQYGLAFRFLEALVLLPAIVVAVLLPRLSRLYENQDGDDFQRILVRSTALLGALATALAVVISMASPFLVKLVEPGASSDPSVLALRILCWVFPLSSVSYLLSTGLTAMNDQKRLAWMLGGAAILNLVLNAVFIPRWSLYGACAATLGTQFAITAALAIRYARQAAFIPLISSPK